MKKVEGPVFAFGVLYDIDRAFEDVFLVYFNARYFARISGGFSLNFSHPPPLPFLRVTFNFKYLGLFEMKRFLYAAIFGC